MLVCPALPGMGPAVPGLCEEAVLTPDVAVCLSWRHRDSLVVICSSPNLTLLQWELGTLQTLWEQCCGHCLSFSMASHVQQQALLDNSSLGFSFWICVSPPGLCIFWVCVLPQLIVMEPSGRICVCGVLPSLWGAILLLDIRTQACQPQTLQGPCPLSPCPVSFSQACCLRSCLSSLLVAPDHPRSSGLSSPSGLQRTGTKTACISPVLSGLMWAEAPEKARGVSRPG